MSDHDHNPPEAGSNEGPKRRTPRGLLVGGAAAVVALGGVAWILAKPAAESTDNAYVAADSTTIAPKVRGFVAKVLVPDNQPVRAGDPLVEIDPEEFNARVNAANAELAQANANVAAAKAALGSQSVAVSLADARVDASRSGLTSASAEAVRASAERARTAALATSGAVATRETEAALSADIGAGSAVARARADIRVTQREEALARARRPELEAALAQALAAQARAQAAVALARQDAGHTLIRAPIAGIVGNKQVRVGDFVQPGATMLSIVPLGSTYVVANFKETQAHRIRPGQPVTITVDALDGTTLRGRVDSLAPGTASTFALLPFEPGTGNFTKIVQRVPVRIVMDPGQPDLAALRPGLSVTARVRIGE